MVRDDSDLNVLIGRVLTGEYKKRGMRQEDIAERIGKPLVTLQKKLAGKSPIAATEFIEICKAMVPPLDPAAAIDNVQALWDAMSSAPATNDLQKKRIEKQATAAAMTPAELDKVTRRAATTDPELEQDEPPTS